MHYTVSLRKPGPKCWQGLQHKEGAHKQLPSLAEHNLLYSRKLHLQIAISHEPEAVAIGAEGLCHGGDERYTAPEPWHPEVLCHLPFRILQTAALTLLGMCHARPYLIIQADIMRWPWNGNASQPCQNKYNGCLPNVPCVKAAVPSRTVDDSHSSI